MSEFVFKTPKADHRIELLTSGAFGKAPTEEVSATDFDEIRIVRGADVWRWRVSAVTPVDLSATGDFYPTSTAIGWNLAPGNVLGTKGRVQLKFHVSTPLSPREKGVGVVLIFEYDKSKGLVFRSGVDSSMLWVHAKGWESRQTTPGWITSPTAPWVAEDGQDGRAPARENRLLSTDRLDASALKTNLIHIDPGLRGVKAHDYDFSFVPVANEGLLEIWTAFTMARDFGFSAGVSDYALNLQVDSRSGAPMAARGMRLLCNMNSKRDGWDLEWRGLPGSSAGRPADTFTLESLSRALLNSHALGLATTRSRNRLSFVPTWLRTANATDTVDLQFSLTAPGLDLEDVRLRAIRLAQDGQVISFNCGGAAGVEGEAWEFDARASRLSDELPKKPFLAWKFMPAEKVVKQRIGAGSVLLDIADFIEGELTLWLSPEGKLYRRAPLECELRLTFGKAGYAALSMDPELGFETLSSVVNRPRPWTIDLRDDTARQSQMCRLVIEERATRDQSRMLRMELKLQQEADVTADVLLVDSSPLTVVRVQTQTRIKGDESLAEYIDDADQAPEWRFFSDTGSITATLPPQGIGEEMVKGWIFRMRGDQRVAVPAKGELFDFRLTPPARLVLDATDVDTARAEAPWSLRRLMGRRLGTTGVKLEDARFELLYGMESRVQAKGLRIAELDGFVGRVPLSDALWRARLRAENGQDGIQEIYATKATSWMSGLWYRPSWWRVYTDIANRTRLLLDHGVEYRLRPTRETADPFAVENYASNEGTPAHAPTGREPLRGGVDWPFQSRNIYEELKRKPTSSSGSIEGLAFGPLGGEGAQTAAFNNGKTLIVTNSHQGRLDAITLTRVGRIAMTWNKARHVIVYERTTRRAPRYDGTGHEPTNKQDDLESQPGFDGVAALRKVREYVEITEPRRRYPDIQTGRAIGGPLLQCSFSTTTIPVKSSWGRDVKDGFAIALRGPISQGEEAMFPEPQVFLSFARAPGKGEGLVSQRITSTDKLIFFSSTRDEDGGDTDQWPAWPDIDHPLLAPPTPPKLPYHSSFSGKTLQPDAAANELGMAPFTFKLMPSEEAVNLMHGRQESGLEARISNINLARGLPERKASVVQNAGDVFADANSQFVDGLRELATELRERVAQGEGRPLTELPALQADVTKLLKRLGNTARSIEEVPLPPDPLKKLPDGTIVPDRDDLQSLRSFGWVREQESRGAAYIAGMTKEAAGLGRQLQQQASLLRGSIDAARDQAKLAVDTVALQATRKIGEAGFVPELALNAASGLVTELEHRFLAHLQGTSDRLLRDLHAIETAIAKGNADLALLDRQWRAGASQIGAEVRQLTDILEQSLDEGLSQWFSRLNAANRAETLIAKFQKGVDASLPALADWIDRWTDNLPPFDLQTPDFARLREFISGSFTQPLVESLLQEVKVLVNQLLTDLAGWDLGIKTGQAQLDLWVEDVRARLDAAADLRQLQLELVGAVTPLATKLSTIASGVAQDLQQQLANQIEAPNFVGLQGSLDALAQYPEQAKQFVAALEAKLNGSVGDIERQLRETIGDVEACAQASGRQIEEWARKELGDVTAIAQSGAEAGLEAVRILAGGLDTDVMKVTRKMVGYSYQKALDTLDLTRASAVFNDMGEDVLNALSASMPFDKIRDRLLPMLDNFAVRDLFPDFCGIKLTYLLPDLDVPLDGDHEHGWVRFQHGFDKERLSAWAKVSIDKRFEEDGTLFDLGPIKLRLLKPRFTAMADITIEKDGQRRQITAGRLDADFELSLNDKPMVTLVDGSLSFDERGEIDFKFDAEKLVLADELQFVSDAVKALMPDLEGLTVTPLLPAGINAELSLPLPDIGTGAFTLTGVTLNSRLGLVVGDGFEIRTGLWLSKPERPFGMAVLFLGGGGWFGIDATYKPPSRFVTRVSIGISAGAFVAINFGFAYGSAGILFTVSVDFYRDWSTGSGTTAISLGLLMWGEFSVLGIASASLRLTLRITYVDGGMVGTGTLSVSIRICWCYTLKVSRSVQKVFSKPSGASGSSASGPGDVQPEAFTLAAPAPALRAAADYGLSPPAKPAQAVSALFETLAI